MIVRRGWSRWCVSGIVASLSLSGCVTTVQGVAARDPDAEPWINLLSEKDLDGLLLGSDDLESIVGSSGLKVTFETSDFNDNSRAVLGKDCLAAAFGAQELVYQDSGYTAMRDQIAREPGESNPHWLEQSVVLYPSADAAQAFLKSSQQVWGGCAGTLVTLDSKNMPRVWTVSEVTEGSTISQMSTPSRASSGGCHHALSAASNVIVETWACGEDVVDEAVLINERIIDNVENA